MLLHVIARGKLGRSPEAELVERYAKRINWPLRLTELPETGGRIPSSTSRPDLVKPGGATHDAWRARATRLVQSVVQEHDPTR